jgi:hypothetical protein
MSTREERVTALLDFNSWLLNERPGPAVERYVRDELERVEPKDRPAFREHVLRSNSLGLQQARLADAMTPLGDAIWAARWYFFGIWLAVLVVYDALRLSGVDV